MDKASVAIVGGGIIGLSIAWQLARLGFDVSVLERGEIAKESSWAAVGMLAPLAETVDSGPARDFGVDSLRLYPLFLESLREDGADPPELSGPGILRLAFYRRHMEMLTGNRESFLGMGFPAELIHADELAAIEPAVTKRAIGALLSEGEPHIDPRRFTPAIAAAAEARGAKIRTQCEVRAIRAAQRLTIEHSGGETVCDRVVVAAGAWSAGLIEPFGAHLPIFPRKGQIVALRPRTAFSLRHTIYAHHTYLVPRDGRILVGATEEDAGFDRSISDDAARRLHDGAVHLAPALEDAVIEDTWIGFRPATADGAPIVGPLSGEPRIYVATGHRRNGVLLTPVTAMRVAAEFAGELQPSLEAFRPQRFQVPALRAKRTHPVVLSIAGSDPSGGAGIQADQRAIESCGCAAMTVPTTLTSQNSRGVAATTPIPVSMLRSQLEVLLVDTRPDAVKIGVLPSAEHVEAVAESIRAHRLENVVLDPVVAPTYGQPFLHDAGIDRLLRDLLPLCLLITPNADEATLLSGRDIDTLTDMAEAGRVLVRSGAKYALIKGGHLPDVDGHATDMLVGPDGSVRSYSAALLNTVHTHGTGCFLSSAIAAGLARGMSVELAVAAAKDALTRALQTPVVIGTGRGYPSPTASSDELTVHANRLERLRGIYFVTDDRIGDADAVRQMVGAALAGGIRLVQLRDKKLNTPALIELARALREDTNAVGALLIVNDRVDVALASDADGVHLGPDDMSPRDARRLLGGGALIGISAGSRTELDAYVGAEYASYLGCGPVHGTFTKGDAGEAIGVERLVEMQAWFQNKPIVAIGGISPANIAAIRQTGVACAAVVGAISNSPDPYASAQRLCALWDQGTL